MNDMNTDTDTEREAFESHFLPMGVACGPLDRSDVPGRTYMLDSAEHRWAGWQAARASTPAATERTEAARASAVVDAEALYRAWHAVGADVAGLDWGRFIAAIATPTPGERAEVTADALGASPDMRSEFDAWVKDRGCDTDGAWSAWQACWNLKNEAAGERQPATAPDPMNYKGMFEAAVIALAEIDGLLGLPQDGCNDPQVTVSALRDYIASRNDWVEAQYAATPPPSPQAPQVEPPGLRRYLNDVLSEGTPNEQGVARVALRLLSQSDLYLIAHIGHTTKSYEHVCWWKPDSRGYTICIDKAGRYDGGEAARICATGENIAVPEAAVQRLAMSTPYYRRSNGTLAKLYDGDDHRPVPNSKEAWNWLLGARILQGVKAQRPTPIGSKARAIYLPPIASGSAS